MPLVGGHGTIQQCQITPMVLNKSHTQANNKGWHISFTMGLYSNPRVYEHFCTKSLKTVLKIDKGCNYFTRVQITTHDMYNLFRQSNQMHFIEILNWLQHEHCFLQPL